MRRLLLLPLLALLVAGCDSSGSGAEGEVTVMTQNLYLGADLFRVALEPEPTLIPVRVAQLYATVEASAPSARMAAIASEIARTRPALVGLQEVTTYAIQSPGDELPGGASLPATTVTYDFLQLLLDALAAEGETYVVAARNELSDVELPATADGSTFFDVRYRDADVILARADIATSDAINRRFGTLVTLSVGGVDQTFVRGWQSVQVTVNGVPFTFVNSHFEVGSGQAALVQAVQASEMRTALQSIAGPVLFTGDINSDANGTGAFAASYLTLTATLTDAVTGASALPTCCQGEFLDNATSEHTTRIDVILHRGFSRTVSAETLFDEPADRIPTPGGLRWPSDHAGVVATLVGTQADA